MTTARVPAAVITIAERDPVGRRDREEDHPPAGWSSLQGVNNNMGFRLEMTDDERRIERMIRSQLGNNLSCLGDLMVLSTSTMDDAFFAEIVLIGGTKISEVEEAMQLLKVSLGAQQIELDPRVAAEWSLQSIEYAGLCRGESGGIRTGECFRAELVAGSARQTVDIEISFVALEEFEARLGAAKPDNFEQVNALVCEIVRDQINDWLSQEGESRWNPVADSLVQFNFLPLRKQTA